MVPPCSAPVIGFRVSSVMIMMTRRILKPVLCYQTKLSKTTPTYLSTGSRPSLPITPVSPFPIRTPLHPFIVGSKRLVSIFLLCSPSPRVHRQSICKLVQRYYSSSHSSSIPSMPLTPIPPVPTPSSSVILRMRVCIAVHHSQTAPIP